MNSQSIKENQENDINYLLEKYHIDKNKYIYPNIDINSYNYENAIENQDLYNLSCSICLNILKNPISCSSNINSHSFCKECIDKYLFEKQNCPVCKRVFEYKTNNEIENLLNKIYFKCLFRKEGCKKILSYPEYLKHINECEFKNILYECQIERFNYLQKNFKKCKFKGYNHKIEEHFKLCAFFKYKCNYCKEDILHINLKEHVENYCKIGIIDYQNGDKYIGERKNKINEGYGIFINSNGDKYEGEFKNGNLEGYGIYYSSNRDKYEGEFKNNKFDGYGIYYSSNGDKYEGEFKNNKFDGSGIFYSSNGDKYGGEFINGKCEGFGIFYILNGNKFEGKFKDRKFEGFGKLNNKDGDESCDRPRQRKTGAL